MTTPWQLASTVTSKLPLRSASIPRAGRQHPLRHLEADLAPFVDQPGADIFVGLVDVAVQQLEAEALGAGLLQQPLGFGPRLLDVGPVPGELLQLVLGRRPAASPGTRCRRPCAHWRSWRAPARHASWSIARVSARRTRTSSNGFFWWFGVIRLPQFQSLSCTVILSPSSFFSWSRGRRRHAAELRRRAVGADRVDPGRLLRRIDRRRSRRDRAVPCGSNRGCAPLDRLPGLVAGEFERARAHDVLFVPVRVLVEDLLLVDERERVGERRQERGGGEFQAEHDRLRVGRLDLVDHQEIALRARSVTPSGGWMICCQLAATSAAVSGEPSWNLTPSRILKV